MILDRVGIKIYRITLTKKLRYHRKIHIYGGLWLISLYSSKSRNGLFYWNIHNILLYTLTFVFIPVQVKEGDL